MNNHLDNLPSCGVSVCSFKIIDEKVHILLYKRRNTKTFNNHYALPGGFVLINKDNDTTAAAARALNEKTASDKFNYMEQLKTYSGAYIDARRWSIVTSYICLNADEGEGEYVDIDDVQKLYLAFNHNEIVKDGINRLISKAEHTNIICHLGDKNFTLAELQRRYEIVLDTKLDKSTFRANIKDANILIETAEWSRGKGRKAKLYRSNGSNTQLFYPQSLKKHCRSLSKIKNKLTPSY